MVLSMGLVAGCTPANTLDRPEGGNTQESPSEIVLDMHHVGPEYLPSFAYYVDQDLTRLFGRPPDSVEVGDGCEPDTVTRVTRWGDLSLIGVGESLDQEDMQYRYWKITGEDLPRGMTIKGGLPFNQDAGKVAKSIDAYLDSVNGAVVVDGPERELYTDIGIFQLFDSETKRIVAVSNMVRCDQYLTDSPSYESDRPRADLRPQAEAPANSGSPISVGEDSIGDIKLPIAATEDSERMLVELIGREPDEYGPFGFCELGGPGLGRSLRWGDFIIAGSGTLESGTDPAGVAFQSWSIDGADLPRQFTLPNGPIMVGEKHEALLAQYEEATVGFGAGDVTLVTLDDPQTPNEITWTIDETGKVTGLGGGLYGGCE